MAAALVLSRYGGQTGGDHRDSISAGGPEQSANRPAATRMVGASSSKEATARWPRRPPPPDTSATVARSSLRYGTWTPWLRMPRTRESYPATEGVSFIHFTEETSWD